ncbi:hypothetical protein ABPG75_004644 [Micractinium tetrahymenae]
MRLSRSEVRTVRPDDAPAIAAALNDRCVWRNVRDRVPHPYSLADAEQFLQFACSRDPPYHFAIVVDGQAAGMVGLEPQGDVYRRSAELGFWLYRRHWRRGIASEAVAAVIDHGFAAHPGLHRIFAHCFAWNEGSQALLRKLGFVQDGRLRQAAFKDGELVDELAFSLLRPEWEARTAASPGSGSSDSQAGGLVSGRADGQAER